MSLNPNSIFGRLIAIITGAAAAVAKIPVVGPAIENVITEDLGQVEGAQAAYEAGRAVPVFAITEGGQAGHATVIEDGGAAHQLLVQNNLWGVAPAASSGTAAATS